MKRFLLVVVVVAFAGLGSACNKPLAEDCRKAILNMGTLLGTSRVGEATDIDGEVRRCKGGSTKEAVACAVKATSRDELKACDFMSKKK